MKKHWDRVAHHARNNVRTWLLGGLGVLLIGNVIVQLLYPSTTMLPFMTVENVAVGSMSKSAAAERLDNAYAKTQQDIYFTGEMVPFLSPTLSDLGFSTSNLERVDDATYPWYLRIVPTSLFWAHSVRPVAEQLDGEQNPETLRSYITNTFGEDCRVVPVDATLRAVDDTLEVVDARPGGDCDLQQVTDLLESVKPSLNPASIVIDGTEIEAVVSNADAQALADQLTKAIGKDVVFRFNKVNQVVKAKDVLPWIDFASAHNRLDYSINEQRADLFLSKSFANELEAANAQEKTVADFPELTRAISADGGLSLDMPRLAADLKLYFVNKGDAVIVYSRDYTTSDAKMAALMKKFADSHDGSYAVSLVELSGDRRHASYNGNASYVTASTYKLFVAYSSLLRVESGAWKWSDQILDGQDLSSCFDDMISNSDNACGEALLSKIGFSKITKEARAIGAVDTSFIGDRGDGIRSAANDQALLLSLLYSGKILDQQSSRDKWIDAMQNNIYRKGIPAGLKGITVADKVGFLDALLHDSAIVYSPKGTYVLVIMTDNSSWADIADLANQIEVYR